MFSDSFTFIINGTEIVVDLVQALVRSPTVHEQLGADFSIRTFTVEDPNVNPNDFEYIQKLIADEPLPFRRDMRCSLITLCRPVDLIVDLFDFASSSSPPFSVDASSFYKYTFDDLPVLGLSALDDILLCDSLSLESED
jgi:hypothetical protein